MAAPKQFRWTCPNGKHAGILAPSKLRKIDIRRYCLDCSKRDGVLVERTAPVLAKKSAASKAKAAAKAARRAKRIRDKQRPQREAERRRERANRRARKEAEQREADFQRMIVESSLDGASLRQNGYTSVGKEFAESVTRAGLPVLRNGGGTLWVTAWIGALASDRRLSFAQNLSNAIDGKRFDLLAHVARIPDLHDALVAVQATHGDEAVLPYVLHHYPFIIDRKLRELRDRLQSETSDT